MKKQNILTIVSGVLLWVVLIVVLTATLSGCALFGVREPLHDLPDAHVHPLARSKISIDSCESSQVPPKNKRDDVCRLRTIQGFGDSLNWLHLF
mgnify:CR=1 FL=1